MDSIIEQKQQRLRKLIDSLLVTLIGLLYIQLGESFSHEPAIIVAVDVFLSFFLGLIGSKYVRAWIMNLRKRA